MTEAVARKDSATKTFLIPRFFTPKIKKKKLITETKLAFFKY